MAGIAGRPGAIIVCGFLGLCAAGVRPAAAQVTPAPAKVISTPGQNSTGPVITFHPTTGVYGIAYREPARDQFVGAFLDQDGNRTTGPIRLTGDINGFEPGLRDVVPFPFSTAMLATFQLYGHPDLFGNNVFVGDAGAVAFASNGLASLNNYTNTGDDKFNANNCGEHEDMGVVAVDTTTQTFFMSYNQLTHFYDNGFCRTSNSALLAGYHQNSMGFVFSNGPFFIENGAFSHDAVFNPGSGQVWFGYGSANQGPLKIARLTPAGVVNTFQLTPGDGIFRFGLRLAVHPTSKNVLALWQVRDATFNITLMARLFAQDGQALTPDIQLSDPNNPDQRVIRAFVAATADNFFVAGMLADHVIGRVLTPAGAVASDWTQLDFVTDSFGNPVNVNNGVDLVANPARGTYGVVFDSFSDIYFIEVTASAGVPLTVAVDGTGAGVVSSDPPGINCPGTCSISLPPGTEVELTAAPAHFSDFTGWGGDCSGTDACIVTLDAPTNVTATFTRQQFPLTVSKIGEGTVTSMPSGIDCGPTCSADFDGGSAVELIAAAAPGWRFTEWSGACSGAGACQVQVSGPESVTATFVQQFTLSVTTSGNGGGHVTSDPAGIDCPGASCSITVDAGTIVQLMAAADPTSRFGGWSGECSGDGACIVTVSSDVSVDAGFVRQFDVQVTVAGSGGVESGPDGIACPGDCFERFDTGIDVVLTATAAAGWRFTGWSGDAACSGTGTCTLSPEDYELVAVTATFVEQFTLDVSLAGNGSGSVVSAPEISCPADCSGTYDADTVVTLAAAPDASSVFEGWSGACSGAGECVVTMAGAQSVAATFTLRRYSLDVVLAGGGGGTVTGSGIACPGDCDEVFDHGTVIALAAVPDATSVFAGWGGACSGLGACSVTMTSAQSVTATFVPRPTYPLSVTLAGDGSGSVASNPAGIGCGPVCAADFDSGTMVTLTATPGAGSDFTGWSGACSGTGACVVTMSASQSVTATFDAVTIASVGGEIAALAPAIGAGPVNSVTGKLNNAQSSLNRGNTNAAANQLNAAINEIRALVRSGRLDAAVGAALIADLQQIIAGL